MPGYGIEKSDRIRSRAEYQHIQNAGKRFRAGDFLVNYLIKDEGRIRFGIAVSGRIRRAKDRNRVKRLVREFFRLNRGQIKAWFQSSINKDNCALDLVFVAYPGAEDLKYQDVKERLMNGFEKETKRLREQR